jgi:hypothetical protein
MKEILANMDPKARDWLSMEMYDAMCRAEDAYVQPEYQHLQDQVTLAFSELSKLLDKTIASL